MAISLPSISRRIQSAGTAPALATALVAGVLLARPAPARAQARDVAALEQLLRQQAEEIARLEARLSALEATMPPPLAPDAGRNAPQASAPSSQPPGLPLHAEPGRGAIPVFASNDGAFTFHPRGRLLLDLSATGGSNLPARNYTATGARAVRLGFEGTAGAHLSYVLEADFAPASPTILNAYLGWKTSPASGPVAEVRLGNLFADRGVEGSTGVDAIPFLQRNLVADAILPRAGFYGVGMQARLAGSDWHVSLAATGDPLNANTPGPDNWTISLRGHSDALGDDTHFLHLGAWGFLERLEPGEDSLSRNLDIGGRLNTALRIPSGPLLGAHSARGMGLELGGVFGQAWLMGEAGQRNFAFSGMSDPAIRAWSVSLGARLFGGRVPFDRRTGSFTRGPVQGPVTDGGKGALDLALRYEVLDTRRLVMAGSGHEMTLGANWYPTRYLRLMANLIFWRVESPDAPIDTGRTGTLRAEVVF